MKSCSTGKLCGILCALLLVLIAAPAGAETRAGAVTTTVFFGGFDFDDDLIYDDDPIVGLGIGYHLTDNFALELSYGRVDTEVSDGVAEGDGSVDLYRLEGLYHLSDLLPWEWVVPYLAIGAGMMSFDSDLSSGRDNDFAADYGLGLKFFVNPDVAFRTDVRHVVNFKPEGKDTDNHNFLYTLGLMIQFGGAKKAAEAPVEPVAPAVEPAVVDSDGDGVPDDLDACPNTPAGVTVDGRGCPVDSDGDKVPDYLDECPNTPTGVAVDERGCPVDSDGDGVPDYLDECPGTASGTAVDEQGCPLPEEAEVTERGTFVFGTILFDTGSSKIKPESRPVIDEAVSYLEQHPEVKLEIQGHTDNVGSEEFNLRLSEARAEAVKEYMVARGIAEDRLSTRGYGFSVPAASNDTREGRAKNRRIEFKPVR
ncbi:MAG: outer membrane beta-barrel domain-containing protein [Desulfomonilia bacterium]|jgi:OOP family OmpA-OmpF porin